MYTLKLEHQFSAAHQLTHAYSKECNDFLHGHNWKVQVNIQVEELVNEMVIDFKKLKEIINQLDHKNLNNILDFEPTAENIVKFLQQKIKKELIQEGKVIVTVWEADKASISYQE